MTMLDDVDERWAGDHDPLDALDLAIRLGVSLEAISKVCDADPMFVESRPGVFAADPARRCRRLGRPLTELAADLRRGLVVPVTVNRRRRGPRLRFDPRFDDLLAARGIDPAAFAELPADVAEVSGVSASAVVFPVEPAQHRGHRGRRRCAESTHADCWAACAAEVVASAERLAELAEPVDGWWFAPRTLLAPPLLAAPPPGVDPAQVRAVTEAVDAALAEHVAFASDLTW
jgi:hypothetical protein